MNLEYLIDEIERIQSEATVNVIESMIDYNDKMETIQECVNDNPAMFSEYFQEGAIDNVKMKGKSDSNKLVTAIKFIPRLIIELIKQAKMKLKRHPEKLSKDEVEHIHRICDQCLENKSVLEKVNEKLGEDGIQIVKAAGVSLGIAGSILAIQNIRKHKKEKNFEKFFTKHEKFNIGKGRFYIRTENGKATIHICDLNGILKVTKDLMNMAKSDEFKNAIKPDGNPEAVASINKKLDNFNDIMLDPTEYDFVEGYRLSRQIIKECGEISKIDLTTSELCDGAEIVTRFYHLLDWAVDVASETLSTCDAILKTEPMIARDNKLKKKDKNWAKDVEGTRYDQSASNKDESESKTNEDKGDK